MPTVTLTGQSAVASAGNLRIFSSDWYAFYFENQRIVESSGSALNSIEGQNSTSTFGEITESGTGFSEITGIELVASLGTAVISGTENVSIVIDGTSATASFGEIVATGEVPLNAEIAISGISAQSFISQISATPDNPITWSSGKPMRYQANHIKNGKAILLPVSAFVSNNTLTASGTTVINATISLNNVVSFVQASDINASGTLEISEEELILLLAA